MSTSISYYHVPSSLICHVYFILCNIVSLRCFIFLLSFIFSFILHPSCILSLFISSFLSLLPLDSVIYSWQKGGAYTREYIEVYRHFYMTHVYIHREKAIGEMHIPRGRRYFFDEKTLFLFVLPYACFLIALWCFELHLVSMLCCSHRIMFMYWTYIHPYASVL